MIIYTRGGAYCYIYFSGNGIYDPDTLEAFNKTIVKEDRYEWKRWKADSKRIIFVRDIYKEWYFEGINEECNTIDKVYELLKTLTAGYKVITVGSSAGGYAAVLFGIMLKAERVFAFSAQFDLTEWLEKRNLLISRPFLQQEQYINIKSLLQNSNVEIYYFFPAYVKADNIQAEIVKNMKNVHSFGVKSKLHGKALYPNSIPDVLSFDMEKLENLEKKYQNKVVSPFRMAFFCSGFSKAIIGKIYNTIKPIYYFWNDWKRGKLKNNK